MFILHDYVGVEEIRDNSDIKATKVHIEKEEDTVKLPKNVKQTRLVTDRIIDESKDAHNSGDLTEQKCFKNSVPKEVTHASLSKPVKEITDVHTLNKGKESSFCSFRAKSKTKHQRVKQSTTNTPESLNYIDLKSDGLYKKTFADTATLFTADTTDCFPGHVRLNLSRLNKEKRIKTPGLINIYEEVVLNSLYKHNGSFYISSDSFKHGCKWYLEVLDEVENISEVVGPSIPYKRAKLQYDRVYAFRFHCPRLLKSWAVRPRRHNWPSKSLVKAIARTEGQLVATGVKDSPDEWAQWRICFVTAEIQLVHSLNDTLLKCFIVLKMIAKKILVHACNGVSSYMMKNIIFWMAEMFTAKVFVKENLISLILIALRLLLNAVEKYHFLPYYMIPERNLFLGKVFCKNEHALKGLLSRLLSEGPRFLSVFDNISAAMKTLYSYELKSYRTLRDELEMLHLSFENAVEEKNDPMKDLMNESDEKYSDDDDDTDDELRIALVNRMYDIAMPDSDLLKESGLSEPELRKLCIERTQIILS